MKNSLSPTILLFSLLLLYACNPDCENYGSVDAVIDPPVRVMDTIPKQVLVRTTPADFLRDKTLYIDKVVNGVVEFEALSSAGYDESMSGIVAELDPTEITAEETRRVRNIYIKDDDCGGFIPLNATLDVVSEAYANSSGLFLTPTPPGIIIPPPAISAPTNIINTWFSPDDPDYCIWFGPELDTIYNSDGSLCCVKENTNLVPGRFSNGMLEGGRTTRELRCSGEGDDHGNPAFGSINAATGEVKFTIDRANKGKGFEEYEGSIVDPSLLPEFYQSGGRCNRDDAVQPQTVMIVKSLKTGRKLVMYRHAADGASPPDADLCREETDCD